MIGHLKGTLVATRDKYCILDVAGVGYKINMSPLVLMGISVGSLYSVWTYLSVRENALDLFGFPEESQLRLFELLIDISGIGPRSALGILDMGSVKNLQEAIVANDVGYLTKVSGIGKKTAEKIVLELREKLANSGIVAETMTSVDGEVLAALESLGYSSNQARETLKNIPDDVINTEDRIKYALRNLGS